MSIKRTQLFHFYLFNFSYKSDKVVLPLSRVIAEFVNVAEAFSYKDFVLTSGWFDYEYV